MKNNSSLLTTEGVQSSVSVLKTELEYTYWQSKDGWLVGYLNIWPDHLTQGRDLAELEDMLADLYEFYKEGQAVSVEKKTGRLKVIA